MNILTELAATMRKFKDLDVLCASIENCDKEIETIEELEEMLSGEADYVYMAVNRYRT